MATSLVSPVLVGRETESAALDAGLARVLNGEAVTVLVGGEAGVGKSRLIGEFVTRARAAEARALVGGCVELGGGGIPYAPVVDMLRMLASELDHDDLEELLGPARAEIGRLVPELDDGREAPGRADRDPSRILELLLGVIGRLAAARPLVLAFEDVQWADPATLDLIALLVAGPPARRLMLVFTVRSDELHRTHPFRRISARWEQQRTVERLELERLSASDVATQIAAILGERPDGALVDLVSERSEGIPLFVEELLGAVREGGLGQDYLPPSLRDVLLARAERLSSDAEHVLRVASCGGRWVPERLLTIVARMPEEHLYSVLRETVEHQLLVVDPSGRGYGYRHSLARAAIHDDLLPGERGQLHRLYAEAIEGNTELDAPGLDTISMLAHHWVTAHDLPRALSASVRAGRVAADAYAPSAARRHYELALELWPQVSDADQRAGIQHPELLDAAADAAFWAGSVDRALALVDEALEEVGYGGTLEQRALLLARRSGAGGDLFGGGDVDVDDVVDLGCVTTGEYDADRDSAQDVEDQDVAPAWARLGERERAQPVALPGIGTGQVERDVKAVAAKRGGQCAVERGEVGGVGGTSGKVDVEIGRDPPEWVVASAVQRQGERVRVGGEQLGGAVALMNVAVNDQGTAGETTRAQRIAGQSDVVKQAVAAGEGMPRVVRAAAEVDRHTGPQRLLAGQHRAVRDAPAALDERG
jgi:AAA ATPase domain